MQARRCFFIRFTFLSMVLCCATLCGITSCNGKQSAQQEWVDSVLEECDTIPEDTLVYEIEEAPLSVGVDENFMDFFYTFTHNRNFMLSRLQLPLSVRNEEGEELRVLRKLSDFDKEFLASAKDYYVLLLSDMSELEADLSSSAREAEVHVIDLNNNVFRLFGCVRKDDGWKVSSESESPLSEHPNSSFWNFYHHFVQDSVYQVAHISQPLSISLPDEESEGELIEGNIDADQYVVFAPELPMSHVLMIHFNDIKRNPNHVIFIKCGVSSSMMDILTFERVDGEWKLVKLEE